MDRRKQAHNQRDHKYDISVTYIFKNSYLFLFEISDDARAPDPDPDVVVVEGGEREGLFAVRLLAG